MRPPDKVREEMPAKERGFTNDEIFAAAHRGVTNAIARHKALGQSIVVWRDGRVVTLEPEEIAL